LSFRTIDGSSTKDHLMNKTFSIGILNGSDLTLLSVEGAQAVLLPAYFRGFLAKSIFLALDTVTSPIGWKCLSVSKCLLLQLPILNTLPNGFQKGFQHYSGIGPTGCVF
jgi:hypothetical protein